MAPGAKRNPELTRLYLAAGLLVIIWVIFSTYRLLSIQVDSGIDAPSRWSLLSLGLANVLAIGTLFFIVSRSLVKLYFERRSGILGSRLRTRLVIALLAVGIAPSLMLFLVGRNFISKNVDRWFRPETQEVIRDSQVLSEAYRKQLLERLQAGIRRLPPSGGENLPVMRQQAGLDLLARLGPGATVSNIDLAPNLEAPPMPEVVKGPRQIVAKKGTWFLEPVTTRHPSGLLAGIHISEQEAASLTRLEKRYGEAFQAHALRETLETLPQSTFLFLTLLSLFAAVWVGLAISRTISEPVRALAKAAQRVGTGDLNVSLPEQGGDELAFLARSFNTMTRDLKLGREAIEAQAERIESNRQYLGQLLEALPVGVMSWQKEGGLRTFNPTARRWFGLEGWDQIQNDWEDLAKQPRMGGLPQVIAEVRPAVAFGQIEEVLVLSVGHRKNPSVEEGKRAAPSLLPAQRRKR